MQQSRSPAGAALIATWLILILIGAVGCGITREVTLPNNYICYVDKFIWIEHPDVDGVGVEDVEELDVIGDYVFGTCVSGWSYEIDGYFIIDTQLQVAWRTGDYKEWQNQLELLEINDNDIRWPGIFFNGYPIQWIIAALVAVILNVLWIAWTIRKILKARQARI